MKLQLIWKPSDAIVVTPADQLCWKVDAGHVTIAGKTHASWPTKRFMMAFVAGINDVRHFYNVMFGVN